MTTDENYWRTRWVKDKCQIANALLEGAAGAGYPECAILLSAILSALAAELWPGRGIDRVRFIELLTWSRASQAPTTVSVPLLVQSLTTSGRIAEKSALERALMPFGPSLVVTGRDVDKDEQFLLSVCPSLESKTLRSCSYACLLYEELRSSYAHEYQPGERSDSRAMTMSEGQDVSYVNKLVGAELVAQRHIHFHLDWLSGVVEEIASQVDLVLAAGPPPIPQHWWINGAAHLPSSIAPLK